jgi:hypothetical protein
MKIHQYPTAFLIFLFSIAVLAEDTKESHSLKQTAKGDILYSRFTFYFLKEQHTSTNYRKGTLIPINSKFEFVKTSWPKRPNKPPFQVPGSFRIKHVESGQIIKIENIKKYSGSDVSGYFLKMFSKDKTDLSSFTEKERQYILIGRVLSGMSKKGVILALGYPPVHKTPSLNNPIWHYWNGKLGTFTVQFLNDKTIELNSIK